MAIFEEVRLTWKGHEYAIAPNQVLVAIAKVESVLTLGELALHQVAGTMPLARIAQAYGALLRHAGAQVTDEQVYAGVFADGEAQGKAMALIATLQMLMIPPEHLRQPPKDAPKKEPAATV